MNIMAWNCRGAAGKPFGRTLTDYLKVYRTDIVILLETRCSGDKARNVIRKLGFNYYHIEEAVSFSGGIWIMWNDVDINIFVLVSKAQHVHLGIKRGIQEEWLLTAVYASPQEGRRRELWHDLRNLQQNIRQGWLVIGDFNDIADPSEKKGGGRVDIGACRRFRKWIDDCSLLDLGAVGNRFTWRGPKWENLDRIFKRLDRAMPNVTWRTRFPETRVEVLARINSDHHPLYVTMLPCTQKIQNKPFRYEAMWELHLEFNDFVRGHWKNSINLNQSLNQFRKEIIKWNRDTFGHIGKKKRILMRRI
ncbi:hypothetical protein S83_036028 [Arachis hypogaea]